jgi:ABC-2 type transport system permease protein
MLRNSFTKWLWDNRRSMITWALAIAGVGAMYAAFWPTMDNPAMRELLDNYADELLEALNYTDIATAAGYLNATVYGLVGALLTVVFSLSTGAKVIAGDEEAGTLDLILAHPITRVMLALQRFAAFLLVAAAISVTMLVFMLVLSGPAHLEEISTASYLAMHFHLFLFSALFGAVGFGVGAATGRRGLALGVGAGFAVFGFAANGLFNQIDGFEWIEGFSPFHWLNGNSPLENGVHTGDALIMAGLAVLVVTAGLLMLRRRDIAV